jgi:hypothetical protein
VGFWDVNRQTTIRRLLAIVMIAGLVLAPLFRPVVAGAGSDASMSAMAGDMSMLPGQSSGAVRLRQVRVHDGLHVEMLHRHVGNSLPSVSDRFR